MMNNYSAKAEAFLKLHPNQTLFLLPNCWNAASARVYQEAGFPAIGAVVLALLFLWAIRTAKQFPLTKCFMFKPDCKISGYSSLC
ncbi:isocitrate lyase/phosphoenolpyruvate mutase family protein [Desertivirga brevis]|uniref:isocitrate lyase/phosphoenolpyruvate mutase family protein n=1 Tax=Desertivirga brevis TaxID=2810310 RepID=UPI001A972786|nr:isocitrate lyase/phosphoenolpyruvate mutase family protein [Pedobacter sp. SYSU D00873]